MKALQAHGIEHAILGAFDPKAAQLLDEVECPYPRSVLVPLGAEPFEYAKGADVIHLCWEHMDRPQDELTPEFLAEAERRGQKVVLWHEEDPDRMADLRHLPILGICSDRPELVHPFRASGDWPVEIVCHRGANEFAPENTLSAAHCAFAAGFDYVEIDVHDTADGALVVFHDMDLARTTPGRGAVNWKTHDALTALDAGQRYDSFFANEPIPALGDVVSVARQYGKQLYVELKNADPARALEVIKAHNMLEHCFFWAFDLTRLRTLRQLCPEARIMVRRQDVASLHEAQEWHPDVIEYDLRDDLSEIAQCRELGLCTMVAYMGRDPACFDQIADLRPDRVNLHFPFQFRDYLRKDYRSL
jgi:glycerophosphoryl diester phosphodiesterase